MKTIKILLSIAGVVLTSFCFGQLLSHNDEPVLFYSASYDATNNRLVHHINEAPGPISAWDQYETPRICRSYFAQLESSVVVEPWMTSPFESNIYEEDMEIESWMISPFDSGLTEEYISVESWMTSPWI
jgi:hypothetical protein